MNKEIDVKKKKKIVHRFFLESELSLAMSIKCGKVFSLNF